ncbi:MAG: DEAD/DEAH box helicase [Planctomycetes bacterium]|nr:DEAD/DEAH box helicase [Planctomycetota bacterium]
MRLDPVVETPIGKPLIVQRDRTVLLDLHEPGAEEARGEISRFSELIKSPEHLHTYRITSLSLWNGAARGIDAPEVSSTLARWSRNLVPKEVMVWVCEALARTGRIRLVRRAERFGLETDPDTLATIMAVPSVSELVEQCADGFLALRDGMRGLVKRALVRVGYPVDDVAGFEEGDPLPVRLRTTDTEGRPFAVRDYQESAAQAFYAERSERGGAGIVVLPCGSGKTVVGIRAMALYGVQTLILTTNRSAVAQWKRELLARTHLTADQVGEYTGDTKEIRPVTVSTYQILTWRRSATSSFEHLELFSSNNWGLVIYDEVHLLPAPVFRVTADLQARRRLGLTATLVREDGREDEVFSLIGPCRYDLPWRNLEKRGFIAQARCIEVRVPFSRDERVTYEDSTRRERVRQSAENPAKLDVLHALLRRHKRDRVLVIGQYTDQLLDISRAIGAPLITGATPNDQREVLYGAFRRGLVPVLVVSKVANFAIDLPDANVAIQVSGMFGSRQEEAQRLGRVLRAKSDGSGALFYAVVTENSRDQEFSAHRQLFLAEQGYAYEIMDAAEVFATNPELTTDA